MRKEAERWWAGNTVPGLKNPSNPLAKAVAVCNWALQWLAGTVDWGMTVAFGFLGHRIALMPWTTIILSAICAGACMIGFENIREDTSNTLFTPRGSESLDDGEFVRQTYGWQLRSVTLNLYATKRGNPGQNVLTKEGLQEFQRLWSTTIRDASVVYQGEEYTFQDVCVPISTIVDGCRETSILQAFNFNENGEIDKIQDNSEILRAVNSDNFTDLYGRPMDLRQVLGGIQRDSNGRVTSAEALGGEVELLYSLDRAENLGEDEEDDPVIDEWATHVSDTVRKFNEKYLSVYVSNKSAANRISNDQIQRDIRLIAGGYALLIIWTYWSLWRNSWEYQKFHLAYASITAIILGTGAGFGLVGASAKPINPTVSVTPFLLLGLGVDDTYVIIGSYFKQDRRKGAHDRIVGTMEVAGTSITVTSLTDFVAFIIGHWTALPSLEAFSAYVATGIIMVYVYQITFFVGALAVDAYREDRALKGHPTAGLATPCFDTRELEDTPLPPARLRPYERAFQWWQWREYEEWRYQQRRQQRQAALDGVGTSAGPPNQGSPVEMNYPASGAWPESAMPPVYQNIDRGGTNSGQSDDEDATGRQSTGKGITYVPACTPGIFNGPYAYTQNPEEPRDYTTELCLPVPVPFAPKHCWWYFFSRRFDPQYPVPSSILAGVWLPKALLHWTGIIFVLLVEAAGLAVAIYGCTRVKQDFQPRLWFIPEGNWLREAFQVENKYFLGSQTEIDFYTKEAPPGESYFSLQDQLAAIPDEILASPYMSNTPPFTSWYTQFLVYLSETRSPNELDSQGRPTTESDFNTWLKEWLETPTGSAFQQSFVLSEDGSSIVSTKMTGFSDTYQSSPWAVELAHDVRDHVKKAAPDFDPIAFSIAFYAYDASATVVYDTLHTVISAAIAVLIVTLVLLASIPASALVFAMVVLTDVGLFGFMHFAGITLNSFTFFILVLGVGIAVDFSAHMCRSFMTQQGTRLERARHAMYEIGGEIMNGAFSTWLAIIVLAGAEHYIFDAFFQMLFALVVLAIWHGLVSLPVCLRLVGPPSFRGQLPPLRDVMILGKPEEDAVADVEDDASDLARAEASREDSVTMIAKSKSLQLEQPQSAAEAHTSGAGISRGAVSPPRSKRFGMIASAWALKGSAEEV